MRVEPIIVAILAIGIIGKGIKFILVSKGKIETEKPINTKTEYIWGVSSIIFGGLMLLFVLHFVLTVVL